MQRGGGHRNAQGGATETHRGDTETHRGGDTEKHRGDTYCHVPITLRNVVSLIYEKIYFGYRVPLTGFLLIRTQPKKGSSLVSILFSQYIDKFFYQMYFNYDPPPLVLRLLLTSKITFIEWVAGSPSIITCLHCQPKAQCL